MNGAAYIAEFLQRRGARQVFLLTGGACAFMADAVAAQPGLEVVNMMHEQAAAMAADACWRASGTVGVSMATSGPGATNLLTGIACSYFDSVPSIHITGQVNRAESAAFAGAQVRQAGFQETDIVAMAGPVTKYAVQVQSVEELKRELPKAYALAVSGRMGPVLIDVPMDVQKAEAGAYEEFAAPVEPQGENGANEAVARFLAGAQRPLVLVGAGVGLSGAEERVRGWLAKTGLPYVCSWNGMGYIDAGMEGFLGGIGVYGNRGANMAVQNCDALLVLGSRLDNRQRSGNPANFAPKAKLLVLDIDTEELKKYAPQGYGTLACDLGAVELPQASASAAWKAYCAMLKARFFGKDDSSFARAQGSFSPYAAVQELQRQMAEDAIVAVDTGAALCWVYQAFMRRRHRLFTAGGMSPMGYALPAAIGAAVAQPEKQLWCLMGDGGFQLNMQELQVVARRGLGVCVVVFNNGGYGIIQQFQDAYLSGRHVASGAECAAPDLRAIAAAYGLSYQRAEAPGQLAGAWGRGKLIELVFHPGTLIEPKLEMGRKLHDQFPYLDRDELTTLNPYAEG